MKLDSARLKQVETERALKRLQHESTLSGVFDRYEHDIQQARTETERVQAHNQQLQDHLQSLAMSDAHAMDTHGSLCKDSGKRSGAAASSLAQVLHPALQLLLAPVPCA